MGEGWSPGVRGGKRDVQKVTLLLTTEGDDGALRSNERNHITQPGRQDGRNEPLYSNSAAHLEQKKTLEHPCRCWCSKLLTPTIGVVQMHLVLSLLHDITGLGRRNRRGETAAHCKKTKECFPRTRTAQTTLPRHQTCR